MRSGSKISESEMILLKSEIARALIYLDRSTFITSLVIQTSHTKCLLGRVVSDGGPFSDGGYFSERTGIYWADRLAAAKIPIVLESCNMSPFPNSTTIPCPYNLFRTSRDIRPNWRSVINNGGAISRPPSALAPILLGVSGHAASG